MDNVPVDVPCADMTPRPCAMVEEVAQI